MCKLFVECLKLIVCNYSGQVVNLLREAHEFVQFTEHIVIPANYQSGITLAIKTSSNYSHELKTVPEL